MAVGVGEMRAAVEWCAEALGRSSMEAGSVTFDQAPNSHAWGLFMAASKNDEAELKFWTSIFPKVLPSKAELDSEDRILDDGRGLEACERYLRVLREEVERDED
jgi:hypothetical protein